MDDSDESTSGIDEEVANFCFMAHSNKDDEQKDEVILKSLSYDELFTVFNLKFFRRLNLI